MGQEIGGREFSTEDLARFRDRLARETQSLRDTFAAGQCSNAGPLIGLELEVWLIDHNFFPAPHNQSFLERLANPSVVAELSQFNIEINAPVERLEGRSFQRMHAHLSETMRHCASNAHEDVDTVIAIGTLPTLRQQDLSLESMTPSHRYRALNREAMRLRGGMPLNIDIDAALPGTHHFLACFKHVMLEAAATSFQLHLQVPPAIISRTYNASVILSAPLVAIAANSPFLFGQPLWNETRIAIFEQSLQQSHGPERVTLGAAYAGEDITELFEENLKDYPALLPVEAGDPIRCYSCLRLQNGTIWRWVRPIVGFDPDGTPHVRIEQRVLPAGPSVSDMMANAAFYFGAVHMLAREIDDAEKVLPFALARENFYEAARHGLDAEVHWLRGAGKRPVRDILKELVPVAAEGLAAQGMDEDLIDHYLDIISMRLACGRNGAEWQLAHFNRHGDLHKLTAAYVENQRTGRPVHEWTV
jgi:gamma-glutamyl:cysteine ligase YbdK (ATP-grasp superfamily)